MLQPSTLPVPEIPNAYQPISSLFPEVQQPVEFTNPGQAAEVFVTSPEVFPSSQLGPENVKVTNAITGTAPKISKRAIKILGGIQIVIGIMHAGFGITLALLNYNFDDESRGFTSLSVVTGYHFWGGFCFIISGAITISAFLKHSPCLLKGSLGMNSMSCMVSMIGVILLVMDLSNNYQQVYWALVSRKGISGTLLLFSLLEFSIAFSSIYFAAQAIRNSCRCVPVIPNVYATKHVVHQCALPLPGSDSYPPYFF
ncbi:membrane-spanning 4-domains subfamily A member 12-like isoform X1 [Cavia porcellus]|uniref:membrane-spanning 4-domains subfamily A member 12-like isoform X1 n=1 Tax=Cavia porcellus TaxID=10141 RepID=UPI002FDFC2AE